MNIFGIMQDERDLRHEREKLSKIERQKLALGWFMLGLSTLIGFLIGLGVANV